MKRLAVLLLCALLVGPAPTPAPAGIVGISGARLFVAEGGGGDADPYPLYTSFNRNDVPWHTASGAWGAQDPVVAPTPPTTTRSVSVSSASGFNSEAAVDGTQITITSGWAEDTYVQIEADDVDVIINPGVTIGAIFIGQNAGVSRTRIRGPTIGSHSGGLMGQIRQNDWNTDLIVDGIDLNGASPFGSGGENLQPFRMSGDKIAILNVRAFAGGYIWLGDATNVFIGNSNLYHGAVTRADAEYVEGWGIRNSAGPVIIVDSRVEGTRYHNIRVHSHANSGELLYIASSALVAVAEGRSLIGWPPLLGEGTDGQGIVVEDTDFYTYAHASCGLGAEIAVWAVTYSLGQNNRYHSAGAATIDATYLADVESSGAGDPADHSWLTGNTYDTWTTYPSWGGPGDPRSVPLPFSLTFSPGEDSCTAFPGSS